MEKTVRDGPIRVMVVDDQPLLRRSLEHLLELEAERITVVGTTLAHMSGGLPNF